jgi:GH24 family phage-related lysozyme (muramidase)
MILLTSNKGIELIKQFEGFRSHVYVDVAGFPTIGYEHKLNPGESYPSGVTVTQAEALLLRDVTWAENVVDRLVKVSLTQGHRLTQHRIVCFVYRRCQLRLRGAMPGEVSGTIINHG